VLGIRIGFNADSDPAFLFYHNADPDLDPGSQTIADRSESWLDLNVAKVDFLRDKYTVLKVSNRGQKTTYLRKAKKPF
jgi:hypothetical protein